MEKCDYCKRKAVYNLQTAIITYQIEDNAYEEIDSQPTDEINAFLCTKHHEEYNDGLLDLP